MYKIVISDDEGRLTLIPFTRFEYSIGREEGNAIRLTDRNISRRHARLYKKTKHSFGIEDFGSRNSTYVDGREVNGESVEVDAEQRLVIGDYKLAVSAKSYKGVPCGVQIEPGKKKGVGKVTPFARLVMVEGFDVGWEIELKNQLYIIGRSDQSNLFIDHPSISRAHARLEENEEQWNISDLDSIGGIHVNGNRKDDYTLKAGDMIDLGETRFRFVAPGEPYDHESFKKVEHKEDERREHKKVMLIQGAVVLVLLGMLAAWLTMRLSGSESGENEAGEVESSADFDKLIEEGRQSMEAQKWEEAARLFAEAQRINSDSVRVMELKKKANLEIAAQLAVEAAVSARDEKKWRLAVEEIAKIPSDSYYYDLSYIKELSDTLCDELLYQADFMITAQDPEAKEVLSLIGTMPHLSKSCLKRRESLESRLKGSM